MCCAVWRGTLCPSNPDLFLSPELCWMSLDVVGDVFQRPSDFQMAVNK